MSSIAVATAAKALIEAREAARLADEAKKAAEAMFRACAEQAGLTEYETAEGVRIAVETRPNPRVISVQVLAEHLSADIVAGVLKEAIDPKAFDAAVTAGIIDPTIAEKAVTQTYREEVRVYGELGVRERRATA